MNKDKWKKKKAETGDRKMGRMRTIMYNFFMNLDDNFHFSHRKIIQH